MNVNKFLSLHGRNGSDPWYSYCEILITDDGEVYLARPSHQEWLIRYAMNKWNVTRDQLYKLVPIDVDPTSYLAERFRIAVCWYNVILIPFILDNTSSIDRTIKLLKYDGVLNKDVNISINKEFTLSLVRNYLVNEDNMISKLRSESSTNG